MSPVASVSTDWTHLPPTALKPIDDALPVKRVLAKQFNGLMRRDMFQTDWALRLQGGNHFFLFVVDVFPKKLIFFGGGKAKSTTFFVRVRFPRPATLCKRETTYSSLASAASIQRGLLVDYARTGRADVTS